MKEDTVNAPTRTNTLKAKIHLSTSRGGSLFSSTSGPSADWLWGKLKPETSQVPILQSEMQTAGRIEWRAAGPNQHRPEKSTRFGKVQLDSLTFYSKDIKHQFHQLLIKVSDSSLETNIIPQIPGLSKGVTHGTY